MLTRPPPRPAPRHRGAGDLSAPVRYRCFAALKLLAGGAAKRFTMNAMAEAFQTYEQALNRVVTYRDEIIPREKKTLDLIESAFPVQFGFLRLLSARQSYFRARMEYLNALVELRQSEVAVDGLLLSGALDNIPGQAIDDSNRGKALNGQ